MEGSGSDGAHSVQQTTDGGYIIAGLTDSFGADADNVYLIKLSSDVTPSCNDGIGDACKPFIRGDANSDGKIDIAGGVYILNYLFAK